MTETMEMIWLVSGSHNDNECTAIPLFLSAIIALIKCSNEFPTKDGRVSVTQTSVPCPNISRTAC